MAQPDPREDWFLRFVSVTDLPSTDDVTAARQVIDRNETKTKIRSTLKKLEKAGYVKSTKSGKEARWSITPAGTDVLA